jgi:hypothetical protein
VLPRELYIYEGVWQDLVEVIWWRLGKIMYEGIYWMKGRH